MLGAAALAAALVACAPNIDPLTIARYVKVESGGDPLAMHDNATDAEYHPSNRAAAVETFEALEADRDRRCAIARARGRYCYIDVGIVQIDESNFAQYHVTGEQLFDPRLNIMVAGQILTSSWNTALDAARHPNIWAQYVQTYGPLCKTADQILLCATASIYNANSAFANPSYVFSIAQAGSDPYVLATVRAADAMRGSRQSCLESPS